MIGRTQNASRAECVVLVGLPGAGKTSFYRERFSATHARVSKDDWPRASDRAVRERRELERRLAAGNCVVVDSTNPTLAERAAIIAVARIHGASVIGYFFSVTTRQAVARNAERTGPAKVPNVAIFTTAKRLQPPALREGFDRLFEVTPTPDRQFAVREIAAG